MGPQVVQRGTHLSKDTMSKENYKAMIFFLNLLICSPTTDLYFRNLHESLSLKTFSQFILQILFPRADPATLGQVETVKDSCKYSLFPPN